MYINVHLLVIPNISSLGPKYFRQWPKLAEASHTAVNKMSHGSVCLSQLTKTYTAKTNPIFITLDGIIVSSYPPPPPVP